jgi:hypothetical protein
MVRCLKTRNEFSCHSGRANHGLLCTHPKNSSSSQHKNKIGYWLCNVPTEMLRRQHLSHPSDGPRPVSPTNKNITKKQNRVSLQNSVTSYLTMQLLYNSIMNITVSFKAFQIIIIHSYLLKHIFWTIMHKYMKITHCVHHDK